jgi:hypothetical protein
VTAPYRRLMHRIGGLTSLVLVALVSVGCGVAGLLGPQGGPYPEACESLGFPPRQCKAMVEQAGSQLGIYPRPVATIDILPPTDDGQTHIGGYMISRVRFHLADGTERTEEIWCIGIAHAGDDACIADPTIMIGAPHVDHDRPCTGDGPETCASEPPTPRPGIVAKASPLRVPVLDITLDHLGSYSIEVGEVGLPDGAFTDSSASVVDERPTTFWIRNGELVIEPVDPTRPRIGSIFRDPFDGVEQARVLLEFDVTELTPGAVLQVRDITVE